MIAERLSLASETFFSGYAHHIQRYEFAARYCVGKRVLDAGCGTGYGSNFLTIQRASEVVAVDISADALAEAEKSYRRPNLRFLRGDVEKLLEIPQLFGPFDTIVNLENLEHLQHGDQFVDQARACLTNEGTLVVSTPNGDLTERDDRGKIKNIYHIKEYNVQELTTLLQSSFERIELFGQWRTPTSKARLNAEHDTFQLLCELYFSPFSRVWRRAKRLMGKTCAPPPRFTASGLGFLGDFIIAVLADSPFPWPPEVLIAVCQP